MNLNGATPVRADVAIVGAGIVGLAHAVEAARRGLSVVVVERDHYARGASVRNFGHGYVTAQAGEAREAAVEARGRWLQLARDAGFWIVESGSVMVARGPEELAVMEEFAAVRQGEAHLLTPAEVLARVPVADDDLLGGLWTPMDCRIDPREAVGAIARWLALERGVTFLWGATALGAEPGLLRTSRGDIAADTVILATGHDLDRLYPDLAAEAGVRRCTLHMLRVASPGARAIEPALLTGLALLRYRGFAACPSLPALRERLACERPELLDAEVNLIVTQRPDGDLVVGDTHEYGSTSSPFQAEELDELILAEVRSLLGARSLRVLERWRGVYAHSPDREFLVAAPAERVRVVSVTSGIGMTTALGLAPRVFDDLLATTV